MDNRTSISKPRTQERDRSERSRSDRSRSRSRRSDYKERDRDYRRDDRYERRREDSYRPSRDRDSDRDRDRERERERRRRRDRDRDRDRARDYRHNTDRSYRSNDSRNHSRNSSSATDVERDQRTIFVQQLSVRLRSKELKSFFEQVGTVIDASIVKDKSTGRSKGVAYVEFENKESVQKAINLTGNKLLGIPIIVQYTESEKNRQSLLMGPKPIKPDFKTVSPNRIYVGNIHFGVTDEELKQIFQSFGEIEAVYLQRDDLGKSKGYAFIM